MSDMVVEEPRTRLARYIRNRRLALRLSESGAARSARVARNTWSTAEDGERQLAERNWAGVEKALGWAAGSVEIILNGGEPEVIADPLPTDAASEAASEPFDLEYEIDRVLARQGLSASTKKKLIDNLIAAHEEEQAARKPRQQAG